MTAADYRESWLWVHFCLHHSNETREILLEYLDALRTGTQDSLAKRLEDLLPDPPGQVAMHLDELSREIGKLPESANNNYRCRFLPLEAPLQAIRQLLEVRRR